MTRHQPPCTPGRPVEATCGDGVDDEVRATAARLERGYLRVSTEVGIELLRGPSWLRTAGDGRDPVDVLLRPGGTAVTVTWRDGSRRRFAVSWLQADPGTGPTTSAYPATSPHPAGRARTGRGIDAPTAAAAQTS